MPGQGVFPREGGRRLAALPHVVRVAWAYDGRSLAALAGGVLYTLSLDGSPPQPVARDERVGFFEWDPSGRRIAYLASPDAHSYLRLWSADGGAAPSTLRSIADALEVRGLDWLANGQGIFLALGPRGALRADRFLRIPVPGSRAVSFAAPLREGGRSPVLAPSGRLLAFIGGSDEELQSGRGRVSVMRIDGTGRRFLMPAGIYSGLSWSPSGNLLAFAEGGGDRMRLWIADVTTGEHLQVTDYRPEIPSHSESLAVTWAPDGLRLAFGTDTGETAGPIWMVRLARL